jgi:predicted nuclease of restriction endonuclease-like (RecB) superfamily
VIKGDNILKDNMAIGHNFVSFVEEIKKKILSSQYEALKAVNKELIKLYWDIGKNIVEKQEQFGWGKSVVKNLSNELQKEFVGIKGFSVQNLWNMRQFYLEYHQNEKLQPLVGEISWTKNVIIFQRCKDTLEREFYIKTTIKFGMTKDVLINHIENKSYEKFLLNQTNFDNTIVEKYKHQAKLAVKDEYNFDFLELGDKYNERELEIGLINKIREFLNEMGADFSFLGNQYKLVVDDEEYFIDLLLYHRRLKSLIAVELKIGKFKPEYAGKMNFYLSALNDTLMLPDENPSIGIIICKEKKRTTVEYALKASSQPIGVATYKLTESLPNDFQGLLPTPSEISKKLEDLFEANTLNTLCHPERSPRHSERSPRHSERSEESTQPRQIMRKLRK